jgi:uncharacterized membrane protein
LISALIAGVAGLGVIADELSLCDSPAGFIPLAALPFVIAAWALFSVAAIVAGSKASSETDSKFGIVIGSVDLAGLPVLWLMATIVHAVQCIG